MDKNCGKHIISKKNNLKAVKYDGPPIPPALRAYCDIAKKTLKKASESILTQIKFNRKRR